MGVASGKRTPEVDTLEVGPEHEDLGAGAGQNVIQFMAAETRIDRNGYRAELRAGEENGEPRSRAGQPQRDAVARCDAEPMEPAGDAARMRMPMRMRMQRRSDNGRAKSRGRIRRRAFHKVVKHLALHALDLQAIARA